MPHLFMKNSLGGIFQNQLSMNKKRKNNEDSVKII